MKTQDIIILVGGAIAIAIILSSADVTKEKIKAMCTQQMSVVMCIE